MEVKKNQNFRKVKPPNKTPRKNITTNGKIDRSIDVLLTQRPLNKTKIVQIIGNKRVAVAGKEIVR